VLIPGLAAAGVAVVGCVWAVAHTAAARGRSPAAWGTAAFVLFVAAILVTQALLERWAQSNVAYTSGGLVLGAALVLLPPIAVAVVTLGMMTVLRTRLAHGALHRASTIVRAHADAWDGGVVGELAIDDESLRLRVADRDGEITVRRAAIDAARIDGEYLTLAWRDDDGQDRTLRVSPHGEEFRDRESKTEWIAAMRSRLLDGRR